MDVMPPRGWTRRHQGCGIEMGLSPSLAFWSGCLGCLDGFERWRRLGKGQQDAMRAHDNAVLARSRGLES